jgi:3-hydroxy-9,10-secoandrosta-1,3,5(10)-triene-9,17-dione monooxygenase
MISRPVKLVDCRPEVGEPTVAVATATSRGVATADRNLVAAATSLIPTFRSRSSETDALARLPDATIADLEKAHLFDMLVPKMYGGLQCSLRTFMDVAVELGRGDGSAAWAFALLSANTWMAATLDQKHVVDEIFSGGNFLAAGALAPRKAKTKRVDGGVLIEDGLWSFNSGVYHAQWDILGVPIFDESGKLIINMELFGRILCAKEPNTSLL